MSDIQQLTELVKEELREYSPWKSVNLTPNGNVIVAISDGGAVLTGLYNVPGIAVADCVVLAGIEFGNHNHREHETMDIYSGKCVVHREDAEDVEYTQHTGPCYIPPGVFHSATFVEDTRIIVTTKPAAPEFPTA